MCIFAWTCSHADMDAQPCRHGHAAMQACRHGHAEMQTWTCRDPGMQTCRDGHAPRQVKGIDLQTRKHGHAHVDSHGDMNMQTWTCKLADTLMQTCRTCRRGYLQAWLATWRWEWQELAKWYKKWLRQVHLGMQTRSRMHSDMAMQTWTSCRDAAMEKWTWRDGYESIHTWTCKRAAKQTWTCRNETLICRHAHRTTWLGTWRWEWPELASMSAYALVHACIYMSAFLLVCTPVCLHGMSAVLQIHAWKSLPYSRVMLR